MCWQHIQEQKASKYGWSNTKAVRAFLCCKLSSLFMCAILAQGVLTCVLCLPVRKLCVHVCFPAAVRLYVCDEGGQAFADCYTDGPAACQAHK